MGLSLFALWNKLHFILIEQKKKNQIAQTTTGDARDVYYYKTRVSAERWSTRARSTFWRREKMQQWGSASVVCRKIITPRCRSLVGFSYRSGKNLLYPQQRIDVSPTLEVGESTIAHLQQFSFIL